MNASIKTLNFFMQMLLLMEHNMYEEIKRSTFIATKIVLGLLLLIYFGASLVICEEEIPFCKESSKSLTDDMKDWQEKCSKKILDYSQDLTTTCCNAEKKYIQNRRRMLRKLCFYKGNDSKCLVQHSAGNLDPR